MKITAILLIAIILLVACASGQNGDNIVPENQRVENEMSTSERRLIPDNVWEEYLEQHIRTNVEHVIRGGYTPADIDVDFQNIERFVFMRGSEHSGTGFVLDKMHGRVYFNPRRQIVDMLEFIPYSTVFREEDLERLIVAIEEARLRDWDYLYENEPSDPRSGWGWQIGILFSDGTMMRRAGRNSTPPVEQWDILNDFVLSIGEEIQERHCAEQAAGINFDFDNTVMVIQSVLKCEDRQARNIARALDRANIAGAITATVIEDAGGGLILEIESEDHRVYHVYLNSGFYADAIKDMETGEFVFYIC